MNDIPPDKWIIEMKKADERLRTFPDGNGQKNLKKPREAAIRWVLEFSRKALDEISEGDFVNLQRELVCFYSFEMKEPFLRPLVVTYAPWPNREEILTTQQLLQTIVKGILAKDVLPFAEPEKRWYMCYSADDKRWVVGYTCRRAVTPGMGELFTLIREHLDDLRECKADDCRRLFLRDRSNQEFCCKRHQWLQGQRKAQGISPDRYGKRGRPAGIARIASNRTRMQTAKSKNKLTARKGGTHGKKR